MVLDACCSPAGNPARRRYFNLSAWRCDVSQGERPAREYSSPACFLHELEPEVSGINTGGVQIKRVYDAPAPSDGQRLLVDRLWPRGLRKEQAALDGWLKDVAPSPTLRKWFGHEPERFAEFRKRYLA